MEPQFISAQLDNPTAVLYALRDMAQAGARAHSAASEDEGLTGNMRDLIFGLNTIIDALTGMIGDHTDAR